MTELKIDRRAALKNILSATSGMIGIASGSMFESFKHQDIVQICRSSVPLLWSLYFAGGMHEAKEEIPEYIEQLLDIARLRLKSPYVQEAQSLLSQAHQLASLIECQALNFGEALQHAREALLWGEIVEDKNLQCASVIRQGLVFFYMGRTSLQQHSFDKAIRIADETTSPVIRGRALLGVAEAYAQRKLDYIARDAQDAALHLWPIGHEEDDPTFAYTYLTHHSLEVNLGRFLNASGKPEAAMDAMEKGIKDLHAPERMERMACQGKSAVLIGDMHLSASICIDIIAAAKESGNRLRYTEAQQIHEMMIQKWGDEKLVKEVGQRFL